MIEITWPIAAVLITIIVMFFGLVFAMIDAAWGLTYDDPDDWR